MDFQNMASAEEPDVSDYQAPVTCVQCQGHRNVHSYCINCQANICDVCKINPLHTKHRVLPRTHREVTKARKSARDTCKIHPDMEYVTFCQRCQVPCCPDCISMEHLEHPFLNIEYAAKQSADEIKEYIKNLEENILPANESTNEAVLDRIAGYKQTIEVISEESKRKFQLLRREIDQAEKDWFQNFKTLHETDIKKMENIRDETEGQMGLTKEKITKCKTSLSNASDLELISIRAELQSSTSLSPKPMAMPGDMCFTPATYRLPSVGKLVGQIEKGIEKEIKPHSAELGKYLVINKGDKSSTANIPGIIKENSIRANRVVHLDGDEVWIYDRPEGTLAKYDHNFQQNMSIKLNFSLGDMVLVQSQDIIATDTTIVW